MTTVPDDKILDRIRRLLALSTSANEFEASLAASRAQDLLLKYNLEMSQITQPVEDEIERWNFQTPIIEGWLSHLMNGVARCNLCRVVQDKGYKEGERKGNEFIPGKEMREFYLFGKKPNLEVTEFMYAYLAAEIDRLTPKGKSAKYKTSFRMGAVIIINERMREELKNFQSTEETRALILVSDTAVSAKVNEAFPKLRNGRSTSIEDFGAYKDGQAAGKTIQFRQGVSGKNAAGQVLIGG